MKWQELHPPGAAALFDQLIKQKGLKNDAELAVALGSSPPVISKVRSGRLAAGAGMILAIHEASDMPVKQIRQTLAA